MTAFVAKMLTFLGVVLYAGGPIDAVTLIASGDGSPIREEPACSPSCAEETIAALQLSAAVIQPPVAPARSGLVDAGMNDNNETQSAAIPLIEVGLRSGIGFDQ
jgi:hypothetical protein